MKKAIFAISMTIVSLVIFLLLSKESPLQNSDPANKPHRPANTSTTNYGNVEF
jgi:hypothetical protein